MPLYEYDCPGCGRNFEKRMSMSRADEATCPHCENKHPQRRLSRISVKGSSLQTAGGGVAPLPVSGGL